MIFVYKLIYLTCLLLYFKLGRTVLINTAVQPGPAENLSRPGHLPALEAISPWDHAIALFEISVNPHSVRHGELINPSCVRSHTSPVCFY
jgi:hypothetical protein